MKKGIGKCQVCGKTYKTLGGAIRHLRTGHKVTMPTARFLQENRRRRK